MTDRQKLIAGTVLFCGIMIAAGVLVFPSILGIAPAIAGPSPQWTQPAGEGISAPACSSSSASVTCSGGAPSVTASWSYGGQHGNCSWADVSVSGGPTWNNQPCSGSGTWNGAANSTSYSYTVSFIYDAPGGEVCYQWEKGVCVNPGWVDPPPAQIDSYSSSFTTPNCVPPPTADIKANGSDGPITIEYNTAATISWSSTNASSCSVSPTGWTGTSHPGISTGNLTSPQTYSLACTGPSGSASDNVTVNISGSALSATCSVNPTSATINQSVSWTASASGGTGSYSYSWSGTDGLSGNGSSVSKSYTSAGNKTGSVTVTSGSQQVTPACSNSVTVYQPTLVINPSSATVKADGETVQLQSMYDADGPSGPAGQQTVTTSSNWSSSDTVKASVNNTTQKGLVTGNTPGPVTITATFTDSFGNALSATAAVTVTSQPALSCSPVSQTVLLNQPAVLSASGGTGNYQWTAPGGSPSSGNQPSFSTSYSSIGDKTVTVSSGSQNANCTVSVSPGTLNVSITANPNSGNAPLNGVDLTATVSGTSQGTINYTFYCDRSDSGTNITAGWAAKFDGVSETVKTAVDACNYASQGTYTAKVIVERDAAPAAESRQTVSVDYPLLSASCSVFPTSVAVNQNVTWSSSASGGTGSYSYAWSGTDGLSGSTQSVQKSYPLIGTKTGSITVTSGSQQITQACINSVAVIFCTPFFNPTVVTSTGTSTLSVGDCSSGVYSCTGSIGSGSITTTVSTNPIQTQTCTLTGSNGTGNATVTVTPGPIKNFQEIAPE